MKLWNSYENRLTTLEDKDIYNIYVCGVTPYDTAHIGHGATFTFFDTLIHHLEFNHKKKVKYVQNITDIDDSIIAKAKETNQDLFELATDQTDKYVKSMRELGLRAPDKMPKVSEKVLEIIKAAETLNDNGFLYELNGDWYFDCTKVTGELPDLKIPDDVLIKIFDSRGGNSKVESKRDPFDFIVWQKSLDGEPEFDSKLGKGRPGWHIECTAMLLDEFGGEIDIHGGGEDLRFPHHTSEIAQNIGLGKGSVTKIWMHRGNVTMYGEKMSKSLGNMVYIYDLLERYPNAVIKIAILSNHYLNGFSWNEKLIDTSFDLYKKIDEALKIQDDQSSYSHADSMKQIITFLDDDLDTPSAIRFIENSAEQVLRGDVNTYNVKSMLSALKLDIV